VEMRIQSATVTQILQRGSGLTLVDGQAQID
jgi:hypothetical protein